MKDAVYDVTSIKITNNDLEFSASGQTMTLMVTIKYTQNMRNKAMHYFLN